MLLNDAYIFDVDGTLTAPRLPMDEEFCYLFENFCEQESVYLATGSDRKKVEEQIPRKILYSCMGVFTCMGNELWVNDEIIYSRKLNLPADVISWLYDKLSESKYPRHKVGCNNFEYRAGMLNFSIPGRDITLDQRNEYNEWDKIYQERNSICNKFNSLFQKYNLEACVGGQISIDIQEKGKDKSQIYYYLSNYNKKIFFGDKCSPGGNDFELAKLCEVKFNVDNWEETCNILTSLVIPSSYEKRESIYGGKRSDI